MEMRKRRAVDRKSERKGKEAPIMKGNGTNGNVETGAPNLFRLRIETAIFSAADGVLRIAMAEEENGLNLPSAIAEEGESPNDVLRRVLREAGAEGARAEQRRICADEGNVLTVLFIAAVPEFSEKEGMRTCRIESDKSEVRIFGENGEKTAGDEPAGKLEDSLKEAMAGVSERIEDSDLAFAFLKNPSDFAVPDLKKAYKAASGKNPDNGNFAKWIRVRNGREGWPAIEEIGLTRGAEGGKGRRAKRFAVLGEPEGRKRFGRE